MFKVIERYLERMHLKSKIKEVEAQIGLVPYRDDLSDDQKASEMLYLLKRLHSLKDRLKN